MGSFSHRIRAATGVLVCWVVGHSSAETLSERLSKKPNQLELNAELGVLVAPGFALTRVADDALAPNIQCFTLDAMGRPTVSGPGYIRRLRDTDSDGVFDTFTEFASSRSGAFGMAWIDGALFAVADDSVAVYRDRDGNQLADGLPERLFSIQTGETGANGIRKGPDGYVYLIGGADAQWERMDPSGHAIPPEQRNQGAVVRFRPDGSDLSVYMSGLHGPYDFDFGALGEVLYFEPDHRATLHAPWNPGARLIAGRPFAEHGARPSDSTGAFPRHDQALGGADAIKILGRANPLAPTVYRAQRLPTYFQNGVFALDWTFGRLLFYPIERRPGGRHRASQANLLFEPVEGTGSTPCDLEIAPDGSLLIATGGRGTMGALLKLDISEETADVPTPKSELEAVLAAPAPQSAWSQEAQRELLSLLGKERLLEAAFRLDLPIQQRQRAIEILVESFNGLPNAALQELARDENAALRATVAWAWNYHYSSHSKNLLLAFLRDRNPDVRVWAARGWRARPEILDEATATTALRALFSDPHPRVREAATSVAKVLADQTWDRFLSDTRFTEAAAGIALTYARLLRDGTTEALPEIIERAFYWTRSARDPIDRFQALGLWIRSLGDWDVGSEASTSLALWEPFRLSANQTASEWIETHRSEVEKYLRSAFPSRRAEIDREFARLMAMIGSEDTLLQDKLTNTLSSVGDPADRWLYLSCIASLDGELGPHLESVSHAILALNTQLAEDDAPPEAQEGLASVARRLMERDDALARRLVDHPSFYQKPRLSLVPALPAPVKQEAAREFLDKLDPSRITEPDPALIETLAALPIQEIEGILAALWGFPTLRGGIVEQLSRRPQITDLNLFFDGLDSGSDSTVNAAARAIGSLGPGEQSGPVIARLIRSLRRAVVWEDRDRTRIDLLEAAEHWSEGGWSRDTDRPFTDQLDSLERWFESHHPQNVADAQLDARDDPVAIRANLQQVAWEDGDALLGREIFDSRCASCHRTPARFGPDLQGWASGRDPRDALLHVIFPHRQIAPGYEAIWLRLRDGRTFYGLPASAGPEGFILTTEPGSTVRIGIDRIAESRPAPFSVMPGGLLGGLAPHEVAHLFAYLELL